MASRKYNKRRRARLQKTKKNKQKKMKKLVCSPMAKKKDYTCYSDHALMRMRELWNARHPDVKIHDDTPNKIWHALRENMQNVCNVESCWLRQQFLENKLDAELVSYTFAPTAPKEWHTNPNEWLTSVDLEKVMKQYEKNFIALILLVPHPSILMSISCMVNVCGENYVNLT